MELIEREAKTAVSEAKYNLGSFDDPYKYCNEELASKVLFSTANRQIARETADECQVLLKNENNILPLKKSSRIAVIGPLGDAAGDMPVNGKVTAKVTVTNSGPRDGKETVRLYIHDVYSTSTRPVKELRAFSKIFLKAGESKEVSFILTAEDLKYYDHNLAYVCEPGDFEIMIGPNSRDVKKAILTVINK